MNDAIWCTECGSYEVGIRFKQTEDSTVYWLECGECHERADAAFVEEYPGETEF